MKPKNKIVFISLLITVVFITTCTIFWKIGKDEIFYLCGNFSADLTKESVIRQLDTAELSSYKTTVNENGSIIVFSSRLLFVPDQCVIELDKNEKVVRAVYK